MAENSNLKYTKWGIAAATALFSIFIFYLNSIYPYFPGDDSLFQLKIPSDGIIGSEKISSLAELIESQYNFYFNYHYRILNHTILQALLALPPVIFDVANSVIFLILPVAILRFSEIAKDPQYSLKYFVLLMFIWIFHLNLGWAYFPATGALNYTWYLIPQLWYLAELLKYNQGKEINKALVVFLAAINALGNENACIMLFVLTGVIIFLNKKKKPTFLIWAFIFFIVGGLFMLASPSVGKRLDVQGHLTGGTGAHLMEFGKRTAFYFIRYLPILLILTFTNIRRYLKSQKHLLLILCFLTATFSMVLAPLFEARSAVLGFFVLVCLMVSITDSKWKSWPLYALTFMGLTLGFTRAPEFIKLNKRHSVNERILEANRGSDSLVYLERYCDHSTRDYLLCHENSEDPTAFDNRSIAALYNIKEVALSEKYVQRNRRVALFKSLSIDSSYLKIFKQQKTGNRVIYKKESAEGLDLIIKTTSDHKPYYIVRGSPGGLNKYRLFDLIPSSLRLYFLDYMEGNTLRKQPVFSQGTAKYNYFFIPDYKRYNYLLLSTYSFEKHKPTGKILHLQLHNK